MRWWPVAGGELCGGGGCAACICWGGSGWRGSGPTAACGSARSSRALSPSIFGRLPRHTLRPRRQWGRVRVETREGFSGGGRPCVSEFLGGIENTQGNEAPGVHTDTGSADLAVGHPPGTTSAGVPAGAGTLVRSRRRRGARWGRKTGADQPAAPQPLVQDSVGGAGRPASCPDLGRPVAGPSVVDDDTANEGGGEGGRGGGRAAAAPSGKISCVAAAANGHHRDAFSRRGRLVAVLRCAPRGGGGGAGPAASDGTTVGVAAQASRAGAAAWVANGPVEAETRAGASAAERSRVQRRPARTLTLEAVSVSGVSRDIHQLRRRALPADVRKGGVKGFV